MITGSSGRSSGSLWKTQRPGGHRQEFLILGRLFFLRCQEAANSSVKNLLLLWVLLIWAAPRKPSCWRILILTPAFYGSNTKGCASLGNPPTSSPLFLMGNAMATVSLQQIGFFMLLSTEFLTLVTEIGIMGTKSVHTLIHVCIHACMYSLRPTPTSVASKNTSSHRPQTPQRGRFVESGLGFKLCLSVTYEEPVSLSASSLSPTSCLVFLNTLSSPIQGLIYWGRK